MEWYWWTHRKLSKTDSLIHFKVTLKERSFFWKIIKDEEGLYKRVQNHKIYNPDLKVILSVGGYEHGTNSFSQMTSNGLEEWVGNAIEFSIKHGFDGLGKNIILI